MELYQSSPADVMFIRLFGYMPDYSHPIHNGYYNELKVANEKDIAAYCLEKGVDVTGEDGELLYCSAEIAALLKAYENRIMRPGRGSLIKKRKPTDPVIRAVDHMPDPDELSLDDVPHWPKPWHFIISKRKARKST